MQPLIGRLPQAVPEMILQVGGSISFSPHTEDAKVKWLAGHCGRDPVVTGTPLLVSI